MKLCANVVAPDVKTVPGMWACTGALEDILPCLGEMGYQAVEMITVSPRPGDERRLERLLAHNGMTMAAVNSGRLCTQLGLSLSHPEVEKRRQAVDAAKRLLDYAAYFKAPVNIGILRGAFLPDIAREDTLRWMADSLRALCDEGAGRGVRIMLETVCYLQTNTVNTLDEAEEVIALVGRENMGLMYDLCQMHVEEKDVLRAIEAHIGRCWHVHLADSNRKAPGQGNMDWRRLLPALAAAGYDGPASIELRPEPDALTAARQAAVFLKPLLDAL